MRFLKLLDPQDTVGDDKISAGEQQKLATQHFPDLVRSSNLRWWDPGDPVQQQGTRLLLGLAASFDLRDLRLADIVNDALENNALIQADVFNLADESVLDLELYFPSWQGPRWVSPIVAMWKDGVLQNTWHGAEARRQTLQIVGASISPADAFGNLYPPDPRLMKE